MRNMKQKFTTKEIRELSNLKFNVKMFSLMKKQLFSFVMMLALIVFAGTSAMAQDGLTPNTAYWHLPSSVHGVQVANHTNTTYDWAITKSTCLGVADGAATGASITTGNYQATITYTSAATGMYRITCTETANSCSTVREFFTAIMDIDVVTIASDAIGTAITGGALTTCNDYSTIMSTSLVGNTDAEDNTNSLNTWKDNTATPLFQNVRYVTVTLNTSDLSGCSSVLNAPVANTFNWQFNYTITGTNYDADDNFVTMSTAANPGTGTITYTDAADLTSTISVTAGTSSFTIALNSYIRWGLTDTDEDQEFVFDIDNTSTVLDGGDADSDYDDGTETSDATHTDNNNSASQHIDASPATPRIIIND